MKKLPPRHLRPSVRPLPEQEGDGARWNPVGRWLRREGSGAPEALAEWSERWDELESLILRVYRSDRAEPGDESEFETLRLWLWDRYPSWSEMLEPLWRESREAGEACVQDPFDRLLRMARASDFRGNWEALQALPSAREALNRLLLEGPARPPEAP